MSESYYPAHASLPIEHVPSSFSREPQSDFREIPHRFTAVRLTDKGREVAEQMKAADYVFNAGRENLKLDARIRQLGH